MKVVVRKPTKEEIAKAKTWDVWEKEPSEFDWEYSEKETCYILDGDAEVTTPEGVVRFGKGDYVVFPRSLKCKWKIGKKIRKHYFFG
ncbi:cupin domain-containing protein [Candidatus Woesearchaeota archaeon]|nr:cupin domain-containing protein [Candidatus Woesearchaeota archaeon]